MKIFRIIATASVFAFISLSAVSADLSGIEKYVYPGNIAASPAQVTYLADGASYAALADGAKRLVRYDIKTGKEVATVIDVNSTRDNQIDRIKGYVFSPDESYVLVYGESEPVYRRSFRAKYYLYEVRHNVLKPLSVNHEWQQAPLWSPDGRMVAFVAENNIYLAKIDYNTEVAVTTDGKVNEIINGIPDWVYEEEFSTSQSMTWASDSQTLCYLKYDESRVPLYSFKLYEGTCSPMPQYALYPGNYTYKYPVAGEPNSVVTLHSYDVDNRKTKRIEFQDQRIEYIPRIAYAPGSDKLLAVTLNRSQNRMEIYSVNPKSTVIKSVYVDESTTGWIDPMAYENLVLLKDFFVVSSERSGYNHLYQYNYAGAQMRQITSGEYDVTDYYGYDPVRAMHYYQSTVSGPLNRIVSSVDSKGRTAVIGNPEGTTSLTFSPDMAYYTMRYTDVSTPPVYTVYAAKTGKAVRELVDNASFKARYADAPKKEFFTMQSDGYTLNGYMIKPVDFNPSRKYPVVMTQYSGPGSQEVLNRWALNWDYFYATQGYIVMCVDGRGTGGRGVAFKHAVYRNLGYYETVDQVAAARFAASLPYVDGSRIGIYGWSYGGYETLMVASAKDAPYAAAVAVAPVTSWRYYDTIYAERYMLTPNENPDGYEESAPTAHVASMSCPLLIMHGTADDNVHLMNTIQYVSALESQNRLCDMLLFPNMNHSIYGCNSRVLVYTKMLNFFNLYLKR